MGGQVTGRYPIYLNIIIFNWIEIVSIIVLLSLH